MIHEFILSPIMTLPSACRNRGRILLQSEDTIFLPFAPSVKHRVGLGLLHFTADLYISALHNKPWEVCHHRSKPLDQMFSNQGSSPGRHPLCPVRKWDSGWEKTDMGASMQLGSLEVMVQTIITFISVIMKCNIYLYFSTHTRLVKKKTDLNHGPCFKVTHNLETVSVIQAVQMERPVKNYISAILFKKPRHVC